MLEREILSGWGYKHTPAATKLTLRYLDSRSPAFNKVFRASVIQLGGTAQRVASKLVAPLQSVNGAAQFYPLQMLRSSLPAYPGQTLRDVLPKCEPDQALVFEPPTTTSAAAERQRDPTQGSW